MQRAGGGRRFLGPVRAGLAGIFGLLLGSCVSIVTPEESAIAVGGRPGAQVAVGVVDHRTEVAGGAREDRYYGRCRLGLYGIPTPILDPKMPVAERLTEQFRHGFRGRGVAAQPLKSERFADPRALVQPDGRTLVVRLNKVWMDFSNPLTGNESILYFDAEAIVFSKDRRVLASARRSFEQNFRYDVNDSLFNQAVWTLHPEFTKLVNDPAVRRALGN